MGGLLDLAGRIARGELTVDEGLQDMEERLRPHCPLPPGDSADPAPQS